MKKIVKIGIKLNYLNRNDRIYDLENIKKCLPEFKEKIKSETVYGSFLNNVTNLVDINHIEYFSHRITNTYIKNENVYVEIIPLNTPYGEIIKSMIKDDVYFSLSPASYGTVYENQVDVNELITFNIATIDNDAFLSKSEIRKHKLKIIKKNENI